MTRLGVLLSVVFSICVKLLILLLIFHQPAYVRFFGNGGIRIKTRTIGYSNCWHICGEVPPDHLRMLLRVSFFSQARATQQRRIGSIAALSPQPIFSVTFLTLIDHFTFSSLLHTEQYHSPSSLCISAPCVAQICSTSHK